MNYLVSALAIRQVTPPKTDIQEGCQSEVDETASAVETDEREDDEMLEEVKEQHQQEGEELETGREQVPSIPKFGQKERRNERIKTRLHFCHPPPSTNKKRLRTRPKILLQLQKKSKATRPIPTYDVLSTTAFTSRFAQELPTLKGSKGATGAEELAVVKSEDYSYKDTQTDDFDDVLQDNVRAREVVATLSHHGVDESGNVCGVDICLNKEQTWVGTPMPKGGYEFAAVEENGHRSVARWVPRKRSRLQFNGRRSFSPARLPEAKAFKFSLLDPRSRRHAVIATFDAQELEILDRYSSPKAEASDRMSMSTLDTSSIVNDRDMKEVDESLRRLIVATSVWVSYCEGFIRSNTSPAESPRGKGIDPMDRRKSLLVDLKDLKREKTPLERASSVQGLTTPTSPAAITPLVTPPFSRKPRRTQSTSSPILNSATERQILSRRAETMHPIFDTDAESSPLNSRTSLEDEPGDPGGQEQKEAGLPTVEEKSGKRSKSIKQLCCSLKRSERHSTSS